MSSWTWSIPAAPLLASREMLRNLGSGFREKRATFEPTDLIPWVAVLVGLFIALVLLSRWLSRRDRSQHFNSPRALFGALCQLHDLDRVARKLLRELAAHHKLAQPARLFLEPDRFEPNQLSPSLLARQPALEAVRARLFSLTAPADLPNSPDEPTAPPPAGVTQSSAPTAATAASPRSSPLIGLPIELPATYGPLSYGPRSAD